MLRPSVNVTVLTPGHADRVVRLMREDDKAEAWAFSRLTPAEAVASSMMNSTKAWAAMLPGTDKAFALFGVGSESLLSDVGVPWLLATDEITTVGVAFAKHSRYYVQQMLDHYSKLENYVDARNRVSRAWLRWCGFKVEKDPVTFNGEAFHRFSMEG